MPPQESQQKELGIKYQPKGSKLTFSAAMYDLLQKHVAVDNQVLRYAEPIGTVRSRGFELEVKSRINKQLSLITSFTANCMRIEEGPDCGKTPFGAPSSMSSAWADLSLAHGIGLGMGIRYIGPRWVDNGNTAKLPSNTLMDVALSYDLGHLDPSLQGAAARLAVNNEFNRIYIEEENELPSFK